MGLPWKLPAVMFSSCHPELAVTDSAVRSCMVRDPLGELGVRFIQLFPAASIRRTTLSAGVCTTSHAAATFTLQGGLQHICSSLSVCVGNDFTNSCFTSGKGWRFYQSMDHRLLFSYGALYLLKSQGNHLRI